jgi:superfamily II DNA or RNA helicase
MAKDDAEDRPDNTRLVYEKGTLRVLNASTEALEKSQHLTRDERSGGYRAPGYRYTDIIEELELNNIEYEDKVLNPSFSLSELDSDISLRPYQQESVEDWSSDKRQGSIVLPTGAGKTYVAIKAIAELNEPSFVVVPTLDLVDQWVQTLREELNSPDYDPEELIGEYTGREKSKAPITVSTYDSAYIQAENLGSEYPFLIFDEVHHLPSEGYRHIAEFFASPYRMGLTATYERPDDLHERLGDLVGGKVYESEPEDLSGEYLSEYEVEQIEVDLSEEERERYDEKISVFTEYLSSSGIELRKPSDYRKIVMRSGNDPRAWAAIRARNEARQIAYSSEAKKETLADLLERHRGDRIIIFTRYNDAVYDISEEFYIPAITHETRKSERETILSRFREGEYSAVVTSQVLDEGINVPAANVGIILSGTGSTREYKQRLGRLLRPTGDRARLYEVVASETSEVRTSKRRKEEGT